MKHYIVALQPDNTLDYHAIRGEHDEVYIVCFTDGDEAEKYRCLFEPLCGMKVAAFPETSRLAQHSSEILFDSCERAVSFSQVNWFRVQQKAFAP